MIKSWSWDKSAIAFTSFLSITAPEGLQGEFNMIALVFEVIFSFTSSIFNFKLFSIEHSTETGLASLSFMQASYERKLGSGRRISSPFSKNACAHI